ncbi:MAG: fibronectin type III domain-containing protein [Acidimicrobiales bacterium]
MSRLGLHRGRSSLSVLVLAVAALVGSMVPSGTAAVAAAQVTVDPAVCPAPGPCGHGPDPAPPGVDIRRPREPVAAPATRGAWAEAPISPVCTGDGSAGPRVQLVYARPEGRPDRYDAFAASFQIWAAQVDAGIRDSAAQTGGIRRLRFVHDGACVPIVSRVEVSGAAVTDFGLFAREILQRDGFRNDRRYLAWMDATEFCGVAQLESDDRPSQHNLNNVGRSLVARVDSGCWGLSEGLAEGHELLHTLGAVQNSAPHSTGRFHCSDEIDRMCGIDGSGVPLSSPCPMAHENLFDCNHDDYFSTDPRPGSYLATHWNTADSRFLARPPDPPAGLDAVAGEGAATLTWSAPADGNSPLTAYQVTAFVNGAPSTPVVVAPGGTTHTVTGLENGAEHVFTVAAVNALDTSEPSGPSRPVTPTAGSRYHPVVPARILDSRSGNGVPTGRVAPNTTVDLEVAGRGGVPASGASAVVLNLTAVDPVATGYVTAWPAGEPRPTASNLNVVPVRTVANLAVVKLGTDGRISLFSGAGLIHLVADVAGWYGADGEEAGAGYHAVTPARVLDTRDGNGTPAFKPPGGATVELQVDGRGGLPASGVTAVALTVTVTEPEAEGFLTAWPAGQERPLASNVNFVAGRTVANMVIVKVGDGGRVSLFNGGGRAHVIADVSGWYGDGPAGARFHPLTPARVLDSRSANGGVAGLVPFGATVDVVVEGRGGVPPAGASAVVLNVTVVDAVLGGYLTVWPAGQPWPLASNVNFGDRSTVPNLVAVQPGKSGAASLFLHGGTAHLVADVAGWFGASATELLKSP